MLTGLEIRDIVLIDALDLRFEPGLNVLTGETGAGKSILLDALGFALGRRGRGAMVREGAKEGSVTAVFEVHATHPVHDILEELGLGGGVEPTGGELILRRVQGEGGPARGFVNDRRASAEALARIGTVLVEVHGQHDDRGLLDPRAHRRLLDAYADVAPAAEAVAQAWGEARAADARLAEAKAALAKAAEDADYLRHSVAELEKLAPLPGEDARLDAERRNMQLGARIRADLERACSLITDEAERALGDALVRLGDLVDDAAGRLAEPMAALDRALVETGEAVSGLTAALEAFADDPARLEAAEERLFAIRALARKHRVPADDLAVLAADMSGRLDAIDGGEAHLAALDVAAGAAWEAYDQAAATLTEARTGAAARLDAAVGEELAPLRMGAARFVTEVVPGEPGPEGRDRVTFTVATNPGTAPAPVDRVASGGELSRLLLALKVCLAGRGQGLTMIFDEIDRGVGGATAAAVGRRLDRLSGQAQVLVVTHSPQVAAQGRHHWHIEKSFDAGVARTRVSALDSQARRDEIARMLAGDVVTAEARSAAEALLRAG